AVGEHAGQHGSERSERGAECLGLELRTHRRRDFEWHYTCPGGTLDRRVATVTFEPGQGEETWQALRPADPPSTTPSMQPSSSSTSTKIKLTSRSSRKAATANRRVYAPHRAAK